MLLKKVLIRIKRTKKIKNKKTQYSIAVALLAIVMLYVAQAQVLAEDYFVLGEPVNLQIVGGTTLLPHIAPPALVVIRKVKVITTAYSSTVDQTDDTPFITASNKKVRNGIVANNLLAFGTNVRFPELFGDRVFQVEDRMSSQKGNYHFDIWFADTDDAKEFGAQMTVMEILSE